jgi:eukaryotic-like serine/threonine-protein kinase
LLLFSTGQADAGLKLLESARTDLVSLTAGRASPEALDRLATTRYRIGELLEKTGKPAEALKEQKAALAIRKKLAERDPGVAAYRADVAASHDSIGGLLAEASRWDEAMGELHRSVSIYQKLARDYPAVTRFQSNLADSHKTIGGLLSATGQSERAMVEYRRAAAIQKRLVEDHPSVVAFRHDEAHTMNLIGGLLEVKGKMAEALQEYGTALRVFQDLAEALIRRGQVRREERDFAGAAGDLRRAAELVGSLNVSKSETLVLASFCYSGLSSVAGIPGSGVPAADGPVEAGRAVKLLSRAVANRFADRNWLRHEAALDPLRGRSDFQVLLMDMAMPVDPFTSRD